MRRNGIAPLAPGQKRRNLTSKRPRVLSQCTVLPHDQQCQVSGKSSVLKLQTLRNHEKKHANIDSPRRAATFLRLRLRHEGHARTSKRVHNHRDGNKGDERLRICCCCAPLADTRAHAAERSAARRRPRPCVGRADLFFRGTKGGHFLAQNKYSVTSSAYTCDEYKDSTQAKTLFCSRCAGLDRASYRRHQTCRRA